MNRAFFFLMCAVLSPVCDVAAAVDSEPTRVVLDDVGVENLGIETVVATPADFEETVFALGRIAVYPGRRAVVSSRIEGRAIEVHLKPDHAIEKGAPAVVVESRQFANPPPTVTLVAPITGVVSIVNVVSGQPVSPDASLAEIIDLSDVYALAEIPEHLAGRLRRGQTARIRVPAVPAQVFEAKLEHFGVLAEADSGTIEAAFQVENPEHLLRPGMRAEFSVIVEQRSGVVSVPRAAIQGDPANRYVFVRDFDLPNVFIKTPVVTGQSNRERVEIVRGLLPADEVVVRGAYSLAFAGDGSLSLKEALDAAHGHEHNADGSEITPDQEARGSDAAHNHGESRAAAVPRSSLFWMIVSGVLAVLLLWVSLQKARSGERPDVDPRASSRDR